MSSASLRWTSVTAGALLLLAAGYGTAHVVAGPGAAGPTPAPSASVGPGALTPTPSARAGTMPSSTPPDLPPAVPTSPASPATARLPVRGSGAVSVTSTCSNGVCTVCVNRKCVTQRR